MLSLTMDALGGGFRGFSALVSGVITCTFYAPEVMIAVFLRVAVPRHLCIVLFLSLQEVART